MVCNFFDQNLTGGSATRAAKFKKLCADKSAIMSNQQLANELPTIKNF